MERIELLKKTGDISQIAGVRNMVFASGKAQGLKGFEVYNASGLRFTVIADRCLDIYDLSYKGVNLSYACKNGLTANPYFNALDSEFLYYWSGGLLATCGLANTGPACTDEGLHRTTHGRIGMTPAENASVRAEWAGDDYVMEISGEMRESMLFGMHLKLKRTVSTSLFGREICIRDTIINMEPTEEPYFMLYHANFGYPLLDKGAKVVKPEGAVTPRTAEAQQGLKHWREITEAIDNEPEQVFFHENPADAAGFAHVGIINPALHLGAYLKYTKDTLPVLTQWKSMRSHDYALGLEPGNTYLRGRKTEREAGGLKMLPPYGEVSFEVRIGILDGKSELEEFERKADAL